MDLVKVVCGVLCNICWNNCVSQVYATSISMGYPQVMPHELSTNPRRKWPRPIGRPGCNRKNHLSRLNPMAELSETEISNKKLAAGLLAIFLGSFGIHKFVLGYNKAAVIMLVVGLAGGVVTCGVATAVMSIIGLIEGVIYLTKTTDEFRELYIDQEKAWF